MSRRCCLAGFRRRVGGGSAAGVSAAGVGAGACALETAGMVGCCSEAAAAVSRCSCLICCSISHAFVERAKQSV
eukprot:6213226-Pleurochrysis_carterae.AAC.2